MKLKKHIVPAAALLLALAACEPPAASSSSSSSPLPPVDPEVAAAELALERLPYGSQAEPGMQGRTFDLVDTIEVNGYTFDIEYTMEEKQGYPGTSYEETYEREINAIYSEFKYTDGEGKEVTEEKYMGTYSYFSTISLSNSSYIGGSGQLYLAFYETEPAAVDEEGSNIDYGVLPENGKTYRLGLYQPNADTAAYYYVTGELTGSSSQYLATTTTWADAMTYVVEAGDDGMYAVKADKDGYTNDGKYLGLRRNRNYTNMFFDFADPYYWETYHVDSKHTITLEPGIVDPTSENDFALYALKATIKDEAGELLASKDFNVRVDPLVMMSLADIFENNVASGEVFVTFGYVVGGYENDSRYLWIRDGNVGMTVYGSLSGKWVGDDTKADVGDLVRVLGEYSPYNGLPEIAVDSIEVITPESDHYTDNDIAATVTKGDGPVAITAETELTSSMISLPVTISGTITIEVDDPATEDENEASLYFETPDKDYPDGERKYDITLTYGEGKSIVLHGEEDKDGKDLLDDIFTITGEYTVNKVDGKDVVTDTRAAVTSLKTGDKVTVEGILGNYNGYQILNSVITVTEPAA